MLRRRALFIDSKIFNSFIFVPHKTFQFLNNGRERIQILLKDICLPTIEKIQNCQKDPQILSLSCKSVDEDACFSQAAFGRTDLRKPRTPCELPSVDYPHRPGSHRLNLRRLSSFQMHFWYFPGTHSTSDKAYLTFCIENCKISVSVLLWKSRVTGNPKYWVLPDILGNSWLSGIPRYDWVFQLCPF